MLTPSQRRLARLIVRGWTNKHIAEELGTTTQVVKNASRMLCTRLGVDNRTMAAVMCVTDPGLRKQLEEAE